MKRVYLDHSATTPVDKAVMEAMSPYFTGIYGNANSIHGFGREAAVAVDNARRKIAEILGASPNEIYFTSGGTEADNWAIKGIAAAKKAAGNHIITSSIEHAAVIETCRQLEKSGYELTYLPVGKNGIVDPESLEKSITDRTILVSIMLANNEIGTLQPIKELAKIAKSRGILFHTDAVQAVGSIPVNIKELGVDMLTLSAHKFYGPKGIGALYIRNGVKPDKLVIGGEQERAMRGGTTNVPHVVGFARALELAVQDLDKNYAYIKELRDYFIKNIEKKIEHVIYNGDREKRLPQNANFSFEFIEGESLMLRLDLDGIAVSSGSACSSGSLEPSHVLLATGLPIENAHGSLRFSFGKHNTREEIDYVIEKIIATVDDLRNMSPLFYEFKGGTKNV